VIRGDPPHSGHGIVPAKIGCGYGLRLNRRHRSIEPMRSRQHCQRQVLTMNAPVCESCFEVVHNVVGLLFIVLIYFLEVILCERTTVDARVSACKSSSFGSCVVTKRG
jgi:hypothetical protein